MLKNMSKLFWLMNLVSRICDVDCTLIGKVGRTFLLMGLLWKAVLSLLLPVGLPMLITIFYLLP